MSDLEISFRALKVLDSARYLFNRYGFHNVGVDRIIENAQIAKGTFYKYFQSKEQLIEMGLRFQTDALKQEVFVLIACMTNSGVFIFYMSVWRGIIIYH